METKKNERFSLGTLFQRLEVSSNLLIIILLFQHEGNLYGQKLLKEKKRNMYQSRIQ